MSAAVVLSATGMGNKAIRIADEVERTIRLVSWLRVCIETSMGSALGTREQKGVDNASLKQLKEVVTMLNHLSEAKVRLDKSAKQMAEEMTHEEELEAVRAFVRALEPTERLSFIGDEMAWHNASMLPASSL